MDKRQLPIPQLPLLEVETVLEGSGIACQRVHPGATLLIHDTFGGYKRPINVFCGYLASYLINHAQTIIDPPIVERALVSLKADKESPTAESLGRYLAETLAEGEENSLYIVVKKMLSEKEEDKPCAIAKKWLKKVDLMDATPDGVWKEICDRRDLFFFDRFSGEVYAALRVKWWKFSTWWR